MRTSWNKGKTKETDPRLRKLSSTLKGRKIPWAKKISAGNKKFYAEGGVSGFAKRWQENPDFARGENNAVWKGGTSRAYKTGYYSYEYKNWRKAIFERDDFRCRTCGATGFITAHHIKSFAHFPELRFDLDNGITLCEPCHSLTDNYRGKNKLKKN